MTTRSDEDPTPTGSWAAPPTRRELGWLIPAAVIAVGAWGVNNEPGAAALAGPTGVPGAELMGWVALLGLLTGAAVPLALRAPRTAVLVGALATGVYFASGFADGPAFFALPLVAFVAARRLAPRVLLPWLIGGTGTVALGLGLRSILHGVPGWGTVGQVVNTTVLVAAGALAGRWAAERGQVRRERARRTATEERLRRAQDLHDGVGHGLAMIAMQAGVALHVWDRDPAKARESLEAIRTTSREALEALREELTRMGSVPGPTDPAPRRPGRGLADLGGLLDRIRSGGLTVEVAGLPGAVRADGDADATAYLVIQEALTNVLRHSDAERATVDLQDVDGVLTITVTDDGSPVVGSPVVGSGTADPGEASPTEVPPGHNGGMGLTGMRARVTRLGGSLEAGPLADGGWRVRAVLPGEPDPS